MKGWVYAIIHIKSKRRYVGSTIDIKRRINEHFLSLDRGTWGVGTTMQELYNAEGKSAFKIEILWKGEVIDVSTLRQIECKYLHRTPHEFNPIRKGRAFKDS